MVGEESIEALKKADVKFEIKPIETAKSGK